MTKLLIDSDIIMDLPLKRQDYDGTAEKNGMDYIITRNKDDFKKSKLTVLSPRELLDIGIV